MTTEIRAARADEMAEFSRLQRYVFAENDAEGPDAESPVQPDWTTCAFVDGRIAGRGTYRQAAGREPDA